MIRREAFLCGVTRVRGLGKILAKRVSRLGQFVVFVVTLFQRLRSC